MGRRGLGSFSDEGRELVAELLEVRRRLWGRERRALDLLDRIERCREPMAAPHVVGFLRDASAQVAEAGARVVESLIAGFSGAELVDFDARARQWDWYGREAWRVLKPQDVERLGKLAGARAALQVCCSHHNGYVRERALLLLARSERSGLELPTLLLRANDWVAPIREIAVRAIGDRLVPEYARHFVASLDLVLRLGRGGRGAEDIVGRIVQLVCAEGVDALFDGLQTSDRGLRRLAYRYALQTPRAPEAVESGLTETDSRIRLWCARRVPAVLAGERLRRAVERMRKDPFMPVRREGLRAVVAAFPEQADHALRAALLDRNRAMRAEARFRLGQSDPFDAAAFYREALANGVSRGAALAGLGETGSGEDVPVLRGALHDPVPAIRAAAVRGIARLAGQAAEELVVAALEDPSPKASRLVARELRSGGVAVASRRLWALWRRAVHLHVRRHLLWLFEAMPKWSGGILVLRATAAAGEECRELTRRSLERWLRRYNHSFESPSAAQLDEFAHSIEAARVDERTREALRHIVRGWRGSGVRTDSRCPP